MKNFTKLITMASEQRHHPNNNSSSSSSIVVVLCVAISKFVNWKLQQVGNIVWIISDEKKDAFDTHTSHTPNIIMYRNMFTFSHIFSEFWYGESTKGDVVVFHVSVFTQFCFEKIHHTQIGTHAHTHSLSKCN